MTTFYNPLPTEEEIEVVRKNIFMLYDFLKEKDKRPLIHISPRWEPVPKEWRHIRKNLDTIVKTSLANINYVAIKEGISNKVDTSNRFEAKYRTDLFRRIQEEGLEETLDPLTRLWFALIAPIARFFDFSFFYGHVRLVHHPVEVTKEERRGRWTFHNDSGPAIVYADGSKEYLFHGMQTEEKYILTPSERMDPMWILEERNAQVRAFLVEKIGIERIVHSLKGRTIDSWLDTESASWKNYQLLELADERLKNGAGEYPKYLKMWNPSERIFHVEGIPGDISTVKEALAWQDGEEEYIEPEKLT